MPLWKIAFRSIQHRSLSSGLTAFSMSLGVALVVAVIVIHGVLKDSFNRSAQGYDLIVGPKGHPLQIVLSTVFYLGDPVGTVPYKYLDEFTAYNGKYTHLVDTAIPISIGHHYRAKAIIGVSPDFFTKLQYAEGKNYDFSDGERFKESDDFGAVVGSQAAIDTGLKVSDTFKPAAMGQDKEGTGVDNTHTLFKVIGVLKRTGTPNDDVIFVNINGFSEMHGLPAETAEAACSDPNCTDLNHQHTGEHAHEGEACAHGPNNFSAILLKIKRHTKEVGPSAKPGNGAANVSDAPPSSMETKIPTRTFIDLEAMALPSELDKTVDVQAVSPSKEISTLLDSLIGNIQTVLVILAVLVVIVAGIGMMVSIYNTMNERRQEIAIMRALGARRVTVMGIILLESIILSLAGGLLGVLIGHVTIQLLSPAISEYTRIVVHAWDFRWQEMLLIPGLITLASIIGFIPAIVAYRQDVATSLKP